MNSRILPLLLALILFSNLVTSQVDAEQMKQSGLFLYKTEDDFFKGKKVYRGQFVKSDHRVIKYQVPNEKKLRKLNLEDSCTFYYAYGWGEEIKRIRISKDPKDYSYLNFGGGNKDAFCVINGAMSVDYDAQGYAVLIYTSELLSITFIDRKNNVQTDDIETFLESKPKLLAKYIRERTQTDEKVFKRNQLVTSLNYLKLFVADSK